jgi:4-hydroxy-2-oxoglutarate aldolase
VELARKVMDDRQWLIAGAGAESTRLTIRRAREAANAGADAVLVVSPHYYAGMMDAETLLTHFGRVADESPCPVVLYNIPKYAHFALPTEVVAELATHENVIGMKDSSGNMEMLPGYLSSQDDGFAVLTGHGGTWGRALAMGVKGGILGVALFAPALTLEIVSVHRQGRDADVDRLQQALVPLAKVIIGDMGVPPLPDAGRAEVTRLLSEAGVVPEVTLPA